MEIRLTQPADEPELLELYLASWKEGYKGLLPQKFLDELNGERWRGKFIGEAGSFVLTENGRIIAHCNARPAEDIAKQGWGEIHTMYVHPDYWRKGYGSILFSHAVNWLREQGFDNIYLWVLTGNKRGVAFYKKQGFAKTADTLQCEVGGTTVTDIRFISERVNLCRT